MMQLRHLKRIGAGDYLFIYSVCSLVGNGEHFKLKFKIFLLKKIHSHTFKS